MKKDRLRRDFNILKFFTPIFLAIAALFYLSGCIIFIPTPEHGYSNMKEVNEDMVQQLELGITTKDDVRLLIGEPAEEDNRFFTYWWKRKDGYFLVAVSGGDHGSTKDLHAFCLEFMPDGKLKRFKHFESGWRKKEVFKQVRDWKDEEN